MIRTALSAAAVACLAFAAPAFAQEAPAPSRFTHEGVTYVYTAVQHGKVRVLEGTNSEGGKFELTVRNGWVDGYVNNQRVTFSVPRKPVKTEVASIR